MPKLILSLLLAAVLSSLPQGTFLHEAGAGVALADDDDDDDGRPARRAPPAPAFAPDEVLIINPSPEALARAAELGFQLYVSETLRGGGVIARLRLPPGLSAPEALEALRREAPDQISDFNHFYRLQQSPPAAGRAAAACPPSRCYGPSLIGWSQSHRLCARDLRIGVIDTAVDLGHPAFRGQSIAAVSFAPPLTQPSPPTHGTGVVALLAAAAEGPAPGLAPGARIFAADVFHAGADGRPIADAVSIARGLTWLVEAEVSVVNVSLAGPANRILERAVGDALAKGLTIVAAAGNDGPDAPPLYPAAYEGVVAVTALDAGLRPYRRAARGAHVDYAAPGVNVWTARPRGRYGPATGTSYAAPFVTAALALRLAAGNALETADARDLGAPGRDPVFGRGLILAPPPCAAEGAMREAGANAD